MHEHHKYKFLRYGVCQSNFFLILGYFLPFYPPNSLKNENFKRMEKMLGHKILLKCTKTHDYKLYCSWDMECDGCNCFLFWAIFCPFAPVNSPKNENFKKKKKKKTPGDIILNNCTKSYDYRLYCSWDMACDGCHCYFSFWAIFCTFTPLTAQKKITLEKWKKPWRYDHSTQVYQKSWSYAILFLRYGMWHVISIFHSEPFNVLSPT